MGFIHESAVMAASNGDIGKYAAAAAATLTAAVAGGRKAGVKIDPKPFTIVSQGYVGVRTRWGKARHDYRGVQIPYGITDAGFRWSVPFSDSIKPVPIQDNPADLEPIILDTVDEKGEERQSMLAACIVYAVRSDADNPIKAEFDVREGELEAIVTSKCQVGLSSLARKKKSLAELDRIDVVDQELKDLVHDDLLTYGVELKWLGYRAISRTEADIHRQAAFQVARSIGELANAVRMVRGDAEGQQPYDREAEDALLKVMNVDGPFSSVRDTVSDGTEQDYR
jgi:SPFH domain / Band 7 family